MSSTPQCRNKYCGAKSSLRWFGSMVSGQRRWLCNVCGLARAQGRVCCYCGQIHRQSDPAGFDGKRWVVCVNCTCPVHVDCEVSAGSGALAEDAYAKASRGQDSRYFCPECRLLEDELAEEVHPAGAALCAHGIGTRAATRAGMPSALKRRMGGGGGGPTKKTSRPSSRSKPGAQRSDTPGPKPPPPGGRIRTTIKSMPNEQIQIHRWVRCDECSRWRRIPLIAPFESISSWRCGDAAWGTPATKCLEPESELKDERVLSKKEAANYYRVEMKNFGAHLNDFLRLINKRMRRTPTVNSMPLDLYRLYREVVGMGGCERVIQTEGSWTRIFRGLDNYSAKVTDASFRLKRYYVTYLLDYEQHYFFGKPIPLRKNETPAPTRIASAAKPLAQRLGNAAAKAQGRQVQQQNLTAPRKNTANGMRRPQQQQQQQQLYARQLYTQQLFQRQVMLAAQQQLALAQKALQQKKTTQQTVARAATAAWQAQAQYLQTTALIAAQQQRGFIAPQVIRTAPSAQVQGSTAPKALPSRLPASKMRMNIDKELKRINSATVRVVSRSPEGDSTSS